MELNNKTCKNCLHFFQTGLTKYMSDREADCYLLIQLNKNTDIKKQIWRCKSKA